MSQWSRRVNLWFGLSLVAKAGFNTANGALMPIWLMPAEWSFDIRVQAVTLGATALFMLFFLRQFIALDDGRSGWRAIFGVTIAYVAGTLAWSVVVDYAMGFQALSLGATAVVVLGVALFARLWHLRVAPAGYLLTAFAINLALVLHRIVRGFAGFAYDDVLLLIYSWSYLLTVPLIPIGIALHEEAVRLAAEKAKAEATARIEFLARVSHELRTPLDTILGNAQLLSRPSGGALLREGLGIIHDSARHLLRMIDDLLDYSRGVAGRLTVMPSAVDLSVFLADLERSGRSIAASGGNLLILTVAGTPPAALEFDAVRLRQVLDNLLRNAARHTRDGRISITCDVGPANDGGRVEVGFTVADTGEGIAAEDRERIFLPFERGRGAETRHGGKGIGMGLTIARQLVEAMGGRLTLDSSPGAGASFHFSVAAAVIDAPPATADAGHVTDPFGRGRTVVIADDEANSRRVLARLFAEHGFAVVEAGSGREAIGACATVGSVDLVICDQFMADGDGWEVLRRLAELRPEIPVVLVSAALAERPDGFPEKLDFAARFLKPLDHDRVLEAVADLLGPSTDTAGPAPAPASPAADVVVTVRPAPPDRAALRELVVDGRFGEVIRRAEAMRRSDPPFAAFAEALRAAALRLDLPALDRLLDDEDPRGDR